MRYLALLRGINVGGKDSVKMAELKKLFEDLGFTDVKTYTQSSNAVFEASSGPDAITAQIRAGFKAAFGFDSAVILRTKSNVVDIIFYPPSRPTISPQLRPRIPMWSTSMSTCSTAPRPSKKSRGWSPATVALTK